MCFFGFKHGSMRLKVISDTHLIHFNILEFFYKWQNAAANIQFIKNIDQKYYEKKSIKLKEFKNLLVWKKKLFFIFNLCHVPRIYIKKKKMKIKTKSG